MSDKQSIDEALDVADSGRRAAVRNLLFATAFYAAPSILPLALGGPSGVARAQSSLRGTSRRGTQPDLYAILDIGAAGSVSHQLVSIDVTDPDNIVYVALGTIPGLADKYVVSATLDPDAGTIFLASSDSDSNTSVGNIDLHRIDFPALSAVAPFCENNTVYVNLNPQVAYDQASGAFHYALNNDPLGYDYRINTIDESGNVMPSGINIADLQNSGNGLQIFKDHIYATLRPGNSFTVYHAGLSDNSTGSISSPITPQPPGQIWSAFDANGVLWGVTQYAASSPPSYSLYRLQVTAAGVPAGSPFESALAGVLPETFDGNPIANMTLVGMLQSAFIFADGFE